MLPLFLTIVDDCSRFTWVYLLRTKAEVSTVFPAFYTLVLTQFNSPMKVVRSDNAPELALSDFFRDKGITSFHLCVYRPQ